MPVKDVLLYTEKITRLEIILLVNYAALAKNGTHWKNLTSIQKLGTRKEQPAKIAWLKNEKKNAPSGPLI
tara:strand:- start:2558 stop:2767 length:210 start_codon:yes stop_codon:yes gene_type:complete